MQTQKLVRLIRVFDRIAQFYWRKNYDQLPPRMQQRIEEQADYLFDWMSHFPEHRRAA